MRFEKLKLSAMLLLCLAFTGLQAQVAVPASGGNTAGSGGSASYTIGQMVYTTGTGSNGSVRQGVQQPYKISVVNGLEQASGITLTCTAEPNPTTDFLILKVDAAFTLQSISYKLYDINGKLLENKKATGSETSIVMSNLAAATYFLKVTEGKKELKTFKVIKN